jgi:peptidoglycan DL-endopeptidase CwlO
MVAVTAAAAVLSTVATIPSSAQAHPAAPDQAAILERAAVAAPASRSMERTNAVPPVFGPLPVAVPGALAAAPTLKKTAPIAAKKPAAGTSTKHASSRTEHRTIVRKKKTVKRVVAHKARTTRHRTERARVSRKAPVARRGLNAAVAFALSQVGDSYVHGASGPGAWDCSGLTQAAYRRAGISLPHSSGAQASRARRVSRSQARPGDLVVGPGHVGIYIGGGYMVDAGNPRVGVSKRKMYAGLSVRRLR